MVAADSHYVIAFKLKTGMMATGYGECLNDSNVGCLLSDKCEKKDVPCHYVMVPRPRAKPQSSPVTI